MSCHSKLMGMW